MHTLAWLLALTLSAPLPPAPVATPAPAAKPALAAKPTHKAHKRAKVELPRLANKTDRSKHARVRQVAQITQVTQVAQVPRTVAGLRDALLRRFGTDERRRACLGVRELDSYPVLIFHERFRFRTLWFAQRLYDRCDYVLERPTDVALTIDEGGHGALDPAALYEEPEPALAVADAPSGPIVVARSCPEYPPPYANRPSVPRPPERFPPNVLVGRLDADGRVVPAADLPSIQAGWRYAYDPFTGLVMRIHAGRFFGPPGGESCVSRTFAGRELAVRDPDGKRICARLSIARMPHEPEGVLVLELGCLRIPIGTSGPRERALTACLTNRPGAPISVDRVQFAVQAFRPEGVDFEPDGLRLRPRVLP